MLTMRRDSRAQFVRYLVAGALNTLLTWLLFVALSQWINYLLAYGIVFALGVVLSFVLQSVWVFRSKMQWASLLRFKMAYLVNLAVGLLLLKLLVTHTALSPALAAIAVVAVQVPFGFLLSRFSLVRPAMPDKCTESKQ